MKHALPNIVFIINGSGGSGKDTFVDLIKKNFDPWFNIYNISSVDKVKKAASILGWKGTKSEQDRAFLSKLKELSDEVYDSSVNYMLTSFKDFKGPYIGFFHIREPEKIEIMKEYLALSKIKLFTILIDRDNIQNYENKSDKNVKDYIYDIVISNNGTLYDLEIKSLRLMEQILE